MNHQTTTNDPIILDLIQQQKAAVKAWQTAMDIEQYLYAQRSPMHKAALTKMNEALETIHTIETALCESFIWALEHPSEVKAS